jgi:hypothetical protein
MEKDKNTVKKITKHQLYFELPMYEEVQDENLEEDIFKGDVDAYNPIGNFDTTYSITLSRIGDRYSDYYSYYSVILTCKRNGSDKLRFFLFNNPENDKWVKVGQFPSLADLQFSEIGKKYNKLLPRDDLQEFKKAIGLAAHGVGAGSFVYLRRIFENLINETFDEHKKIIRIPEEEFRLKKMSEKVESIKQYLPSQLVEMKSVYGVLSSGVHELTEQQCLAYFPALRLSIELILDQKIDMDTKKKRDDSVKKEISEISQKIRN